MGFTEEVIQIAKYSVSWVRNEAYWKYYAVFGILYFVANLFDPSTFAKLFEFQTTGIMVAVFVVLLYLLAFLAIAVLSVKLLFKIMAEKFPAVREFSLMNILKLVAVNILEALAAFFSVFELKWLALLAATAVFAGGAFLSLSNLWVAVPLGVIAGVLAMAYTVILIRNVIRLSLSVGFFVEGVPVVDSLKNAWNSTSGKALKIFVILLVETVIVAAITFLELIPSFVAQVGDAVFNFVGIPIRPLSALVAALFTPATVIIQMFFYVAIYEWVKRQVSGQVSPPLTTAAPISSAKRAPVKKKK